MFPRFLCAALALLAPLAVSATDLVIDRVVIKKHPIPAPYYLAIKVKAGHAEETWNIPAKSYGSDGMNAGELDIPVNLTIPNVKLNTWATFTISFDSDPKRVITSKPQKEHTGKIEISPNSREYLFTPALYNTPFIYQLYWHTK